MALKSNTTPIIPHSAKLLQQIKQVCVTYITPRYFWLAAAIVSLIPLTNLLALMSKRRSQPDFAGPLLFALGMPLLIAVPILVGFAKSQLAHARARLTPQFLPAHLIVLSSILSVLLLMLPLLIAEVAALPPLGIIALAGAIGVPALWGAHLNRFTPMLLAIVTFYSVLTKWGISWWIIDSSKHLGIHAAIVVTGVTLVIAWLWRLTQLHEEMHDYQNMNQWFLARRTGTDAVEQRRLVATQVRRNWFLGNVGDWWHTRLGGYYGGSRAGLVRLLRYGFQPAPIEFQGLMFTAMVLCMGIFFTQSGIFPRNGVGMGRLFFVVQFGIILSGYIAGEMLAQRRPRTANEMLLPLSRGQLIDGLFAAAAWNSFVVWLMIHATIAIVAATAVSPISRGETGVFLILSSTSLFAAVGMALRVSVWPSLLKRIVGYSLGCGMLFPIFVIWAEQRETCGYVPFIAAAIAWIAIGILAIRSARRAWLNLEFV